MTPSRAPFLAALFLLFALLLSATAGAAPSLSVTVDHDDAIGRAAAYFPESGEPLKLPQAEAAYQAGSFSPGRHPVLTFGIGPNPVWIHFTVSNPTADAVTRRLAIETPWLDRVEVYFRHGGATVASYKVGDREPFGTRPVHSRYFDFDHDFAPGVSDVFLRIATADPMVVPMYLLSPQQAQQRETFQNYSFGFLYGFLLALLAYNAMLYAGLRHPRYIFYSLYLGMFLLMNLSYTGHGFAWFWPNSPQWAQWSNPIFMYLYGASGLIFATRFLDTRERFRRSHKAVLVFLGVFGVALALAIAFGQQRFVLLAAFSFAFLFATIMLALGVMAVRSGQTPARYFLVAAVAAMLGAVSTALSTWGFIPFNTWTFRAVDIGMLLDATLLALALTYQFRVGQKQRLRAEELATLDPLTGINNRRAFYDKTAALWNSTRRLDHDVSVILLDIDRFKNINDAFGHAYGDEVLTATAELLSRCVREQDVIARWGGEEFILLLPETDAREAAALAERLRREMATIRMHQSGIDSPVTASFGVAQREAHHPNLEALISAADHFLYQSKALGRDRVTYKGSDPGARPYPICADAS